MRLHVGQAALRGAIERYARRFDLVEVRADLAHLPRPSRLRRWRKKAPDGFCFAVVVPAGLAALGTTPVSDDDRAAAIDETIQIAAALEAEWLVVKTPTAVTPSPRYKRRLAELAGALRSNGEAVAQRIAWEPSGLWEDGDVRRTCRELDLHAVVDLGRVDGPATDAAVVYSRIRALGDQHRLSQATAERIGERAAAFEEAFVILEGQGAVRASASLRRTARDEAVLLAEEALSDDELADLLADDSAFFDKDENAAEPEFDDPDSGDDHDTAGAPASDDDSEESPTA